MPWRPSAIHGRNVHSYNRVVERTFVEIRVPHCVLCTLLLNTKSLIEKDREWERGMVMEREGELNVCVCEGRRESWTSIGKSEEEIVERERERGKGQKGVSRLGKARGGSRLRVRQLTANKASPAIGLFATWSKRWLFNRDPGVRDASVQRSYTLWPKSAKAFPLFKSLSFHETELSTVSMG